MIKLEKMVKIIKKDLGCRNQKELAEALEVNEVRIKSLESGKVADFKSIEVLVLVEKFNYNPIWILSGKGEMKIASTPSNATIQLGDNNNNIIVGNGNGSININTEKFNHKEDIKDIIELLEYAPAGFLTIIKSKLIAFREMSHF